MSRVGMATNVESDEAREERLSMANARGRLNFSMLCMPRVKMHALSIVLINAQLLFYSEHDSYMYIRKTKILSLMCWLATSTLKYSSVTKIEIIAESSIFYICILAIICFISQVL